jgi:predicted nucleic acid-binding protein
MPDTVVVDTDVLIDAARNVSEAVACLEQVEQKASLAISAATEMELIVGCRNKAELRSLEQFLSRFRVLPLNEQISETAVDLLRRYRLSHGLLIADALIAATALSSGIPFVTKNVSNTRPMTTAGRLAIGRYFRFVRRCAGLWRFFYQQRTETPFLRERCLHFRNHSSDNGQQRIKRTRSGVSVQSALVRCPFLFPKPQ